MNHIRNFCDRELLELRETAKEVCIQTNDRVLKELLKIALIEVNGELDERKIRKEGNK